MDVFITCEYQFGDETGTGRAYTSLEAARAYLESRVPAHDRIVWREAYPGCWLGRIKGAAKELSLYVNRFEVLE